MRPFPFIPIPLRAFAPLLDRSNVLHNTGLSETPKVSADAAMNRPPWIERLPLKGFNLMKTWLLAFALAAFGFALSLQPASADGILKNHHTKPYCEPGYQLVE